MGPKLTPYFRFFIHLFCWSVNTEPNSPAAAVFFPTQCFSHFDPTCLWQSVLLSHSLSFSLTCSCTHCIQSNLVLPAINMCFVRLCRLCSATLVDLQLLSNTYCQASETCNLSFARRHLANSTRYINKKNDCSYACQKPACVWERVRERTMN